MPGVGGNVINYLQVSSADINAVAKTATFDTDWVDVGNTEWFGLYIETESSSGTSPTLDIDVEGTIDGGTTVLQDYPAAENSQTGAAMTQITGDTVAFKAWRNFFPVGASGGLNGRVRFEVTIGGTSPSFTCTMVLFRKNANVWV
jgi:hypothetical protein